MNWDMGTKTKWSKWIGLIVTALAFPTMALAQDVNPAKEALRLGTEEFGPNDPSTAILLNNLAALYDDQGRYAEAEPLYQRALAIWEKALGPEHPHVATSLENYASLLRQTARAVEAARMVARAKAIRAKHAQDNPVE